MLKLSALKEKGGREWEKMVCMCMCFHNTHSVVATAARQTYPAGNSI